ncbi:hypothetical protein EBZ37_10355, partial [bacterium]|nr:hypothetical protein [bacterium]
EKAESPAPRRASKAPAKPLAGASDKPAAPKSKSSTKSESEEEAESPASQASKAKPSRARGGAKVKPERSEDEAESPMPSLGRGGSAKKAAEGPVEKEPKAAKPKRRIGSSEEENDRTKRIKPSQGAGRTAPRAALRAKASKKKSPGEEKEKVEATLAPGWESQVMALLFSHAEANMAQAFKTFQSPAEFVEVDGYAIEPGKLTEMVSFELPMILGCAMEEALRRLKKRGLAQSATISTVLDRLEAIFRMQSFHAWLYCERFNAEDLEDGDPLTEYLSYVGDKVQYFKLVTSVFSLLKTGL